MTMTHTKEGLALLVKAIAAFNAAIKNNEISAANELQEWVWKIHVAHSHITALETSNGSDSVNYDCRTGDRIHLMGHGDCDVLDTTPGAVHLCPLNGAGIFWVSYETLRLAGSTYIKAASTSASTSGNLDGRKVR
jgi:hypothetical protein